MRRRFSFNKGFVGISFAVGLFRESEFPKKIKRRYFALLIDQQRFTRTPGRKKR